MVADAYDAVPNVARQRNSLPRLIVFCHNELRLFLVRTCCGVATFELDGRHRCTAWPNSSPDATKPFPHAPLGNGFTGQFVLAAYIAGESG
jgi:hypothetical protein